MNPGRGWPRVVRGGLLSGACLGLSLAGHAWAGGHVYVSPVMLIVGLLLSGMCIAAADAQRGFAGIVTVFAIAQVVLHLVAGAGAPHGHAATAVPGWGMVFAHATGALVLSAMLAYGERVVWALHALLRLPVVAALSQPVPVPSRPRPPARFPVPVPLSGVFPSGGAQWRGPPVHVS